MKNVLAILAIIAPLFLFAQLQTDGLPDIRSVDSIRVIKVKLNPTDSVRKIRFITFSYTQNPISKGLDTARVNGALHDSLTLLQTLFARIYNENMEAAAVTRAAYSNNQKGKGVNEYYKMFRRIANRNYDAVTWQLYKTAYLGKWNIATSSTTHSLTISETAQAASRAQRDLPVPSGQTRFSGSIRIICENRIELVNYFSANQVIVLDAIAPGVYMSLDGSTFITKATN